MIIVADTIDDIEKRLKVADGNTLVVFDCDEVLTTLSEQVWQTRNHDFFVEWCAENISNFSEEALYEIATSILVSSKNLLVNQRMPELVESLHRRDIKSIVLTALSTQPVAAIRDPMAWRISTLESFGYNFKMFWPSLSDKYFREFGKEYPPAYGSGVICCGSIPKSQCLMGFLAYANVMPNEVIFIDDKMEHLEDVEVQCALAKIKFLGIRYTESHKLAQTTPFCANKIKYQLTVLKEKNIWIPDSDVEENLASSSKFEYQLATPTEDISMLDTEEQPASISELK
ncbi:MAG: DUF2608 domain-containing protein [Puniceicoccales bacterium]|jgi:predicted transcriptional regulator|nr:DUF2608 domain-containing protein [Puniceicoccales bacterium]